MRISISFDVAAILYTVSAVLFILALRGLSSPESSRKGNIFGMLGIAIAIITTALSAGLWGQSLLFAFTAMAIGGLLGAVIAKKNTNDGYAPASCCFSFISWLGCCVSRYSCFLQSGKFRYTIR